MLERVQKILAKAGIASRRKCEELITEGKVQVNNKKIKLGDKADIEKDLVTVSGRRILPEKKVYFLLNKPKKVLSTVSDPQGRRTVVDLIEAREKIFPVGRLDKDARGLVLLTNDGDLANKIMHPRYNIEKTYIVSVREQLKEEDIRTLKKGVFIEGRKVLPSQVFEKNKNCVEITIHEGRKHIIKRIFFKLGYFVTDLLRTKIAGLSISGIKESDYRQLSADELNNLRRHLQLLQ